MWEDSVILIPAHFNAKSEKGKDEGEGEFEKSARNTPRVRDHRIG